MAAAEGRAPEPPEHMSTVGGELLGEVGTQVDRGPGVPALPGDLTSKSWIVADAETGEVFAAHNAHWPLPPASTLKMLFADTVMPGLDRQDVYRARPEDFAGLGEGSSSVGVADGQTYTVEDLWHGALLASGNDAVYALAAMNGGVERTVGQMNARARELQALDTHAVNPDGYDAEGQTSSAYDLTLIARDAMLDADFREYVALPRADFPGEGSGEDRETYEIQNTNRLLVGAQGLEPYEGIAGVKNGYTTQAGHTFTGVAERDGRVLLVTAMAPDEEQGPLAVYREAAALLDWGFAAAGQARPVGELVPPRDQVPAAGAGQQEAEQSPEAEAAGGQTASSAESEQPVSGFLVLAFTVAGLAVLTLAAYLFHRRHPLPSPAALRSLPGRRARRHEDADGD
ncbi:D-alanyl-D-alanine carboxypeptidase [Streptomyces hoynatensis]|uniref:D-alanyl-D-alanine carboxypeptidase n=2 Tax=Streptomyces hoynatensis TaxID=1141874 RepID=A0A3A9ZG53_9ACTN|nr:serine hydrolase [Streptomyces hoynatensis]RKN47250.1 D-alanyl-D-alanine carboxypeptidase [Streptomyces hoynatensis]